MEFTPTAEKLIPDLSLKEELVLLARALWREGYNDHLAGHITVALGDGTLLCNPWLITWNELRPEQVIRIDLEGKLIEGDWPVPLGIPLHLQLHKLRDDVKWALHNHPLYGTVWADMGEVPPIMDQSSALGGGRLVAVDEYDGPVNDPTSCSESHRGDGRRGPGAARGPRRLRAGWFSTGGAPACGSPGAALSAGVARARRRFLGRRRHSHSRISRPCRSRTGKASSASGKRWCARSCAPTRPCSTTDAGRR